MRSRTLAVLFALFAALGGVVILGASQPAPGSLTETWVSDTPRENRVNHHAVGVGPAGEVVVAPVAELPGGGVSLTDTSCALVRLDPADGSTLWRRGVPATDCFTHALTEPALADVDGDGGLEVAVSTTEEALVVRDAATGAEQWRVPLSTYGYGRPTVANLTAAPGPEVVTSDIDATVVAATADGSTLWRRPLNATAWQHPAVWAAPLVDDFDADDQPEVLVGTNRGPAVLGADGSVEWRRNGSATYVATARVDADPAVEVFTAGAAAIRAYDGASGNLTWARELPNGRIRTAADGDADGTVEVYVGQVGGTVLALNARTGATEWSTTVAAGDDVTVPPPTLGDVDGDGRSEVVAATSAGIVSVLDPASGAEIGAYGRDVPVWTFPTPADTDGDGTAEVLVRYGDGRVVALSYG
ncbi:MAG: PQQ-binding-like beta-propeller repeat protein [Salinirussus sp.]